MKASGSLSAIALSLGLAFTSSAAGEHKYAFVTAKKPMSENEVRIQIPCSRLGDTSQADADTLTEIDSAVHGYDRNPYLDEGYRDELAKMFLSAVSRELFKKPYEGYHNTPSEKRIGYMFTKLRSHAVMPSEIKNVLTVCRA